MSERLAAPDTCMFRRLDNNNVPVHVCDRTDTELITLAGGALVRLCPKHRSWTASLAPAETEK